MAVLKVEGTEAFARSLHAACLELATLGGASGDAVQLLAATADARVPRRTGRLARSRSVTVDATPGGGAVLGYAAPYAAVINFGWPARSITAQPFLTGALADQRAAVEQLYTDRVAGIIAGVHS